MYQPRLIPFKNKKAEWFAFMAQMWLEDNFKFNCETAEEACLKAENALEGDETFTGELGRFYKLIAIEV